MDFLSGYGSASDDDEPQKQVEVQNTQPKIEKKEEVMEPVNPADYEDIIEYEEAVTTSSKDSDDPDRIVFGVSSEKRKNDTFSDFSISTKKREREETKPQPETLKVTLFALFSVDII